MPLSSEGTTVTARASKPSRKKSPRKPAKKPRTASTQRVRPFRLDPTLRPSNVDLHVEVDPQRGPAFRGEVSLELDSSRRRRRIELHAADLRVARASVETDGGTHRGKIVLHPDRETVEIRFSSLLPAGSLRLRLSFSGRLRTDLCGLYRAEVGGARYAFTQLEAADARKFFPCFDEPGMKARFQLSVTTALTHAVISNSPPSTVDELEDGRKTVHFERTPLLSTYLVALAVGDLECSRVTRAGRTPIRVWHVPGKNDLTAFGLEAARESLLRLEKYFGMPYPYGKLDLVAVPDFEFGAMENAGAVFFRETLLLTDPATVTLAEKKRAAEVICHELAHMWFGNLVTMAWWDDLWLNEAFATWMAFWIVDRWKPEWKMWHDFQHHRAPALELDGLKNTHPIYTRVRTPEDANANFDVITYEKGASVVRMIERFLGEAPFRRGVRRYIKRHRESNASGSDLWSALEEASGENIEEIVRAWIEQPGFPIVRVETKRVRGQNRLELSQEPMTEDGRRSSSQTEPAWPIPWVGHLGTRKASSGQSQRHLLRGRREQIPLAVDRPRFVYGNAEESGFFRVQHGPREHAALLDHADELSVSERIGWVGHQWALARTGRAPLASLVDILERLAGDLDPDVLTAVERPLSILSRRLAPTAAPGTSDRLEAWIRQLFGPSFEQVGWQGGPRESRLRRLRRSRLLGIVANLGHDDDLVGEANLRCADYLADRDSLDPDLADSVVGIAAARGGPRLYSRLHRASRSAHTPQESRRFLLALADFENPDLIDRTLGLLLTDEIATQDVVFVLTRLFSNTAATQKTWDFVRRQWPHLRRRMPSMLAGRLIDVTPLLGTRAHRREVAAFFRNHPVPSGDRALKQALERFDSWTRFQPVAARELELYLGQK